MSEPRVVQPESSQAALPLPPMSARRPGVSDRIFDPKATAIGLVIAMLIFSVAFIWKIQSMERAKRAELREFEFALAEPVQETFRIPNPTRDFLRVADPDALSMAVTEERPNIHITRVPNTTPVYTEVIEVRTPGGISSSDIKEFKIDLRDFEPGATASVGGDVVVDDNPETITFPTERAEYAIPVIGAETKGPADLFKYDQPAPPDKIGTYLFNVGPRPGRAMRRMAEAFGDQDAPSFGTLGPANINLFGTGDIFRTMGRAGGLRAKSAVDSALHWLAIHQEPDGMWDCTKYEGTAQGSLASTGLAVLALLSGGHTTRKGEYSRQVLKGLNAIMRNQNEEGRISAQGTNLYTHAICTIALAEAYGRARDEQIGGAAQRAINYAEKVVAPDGGWRYTPKPPASDMSVTAWFIQALKTAKIAGLKTDETIYNQALAFVDSVTHRGGTQDSNGSVGYMVSGEDHGGGGHIALTAAGMMVRQFSGTSPRHHLLVKGANILRNNPPNWNRKDFYYWYYATYAMHNMGGSHRLWWNQKIRDVLLENQNRDGDRAGSWDPAGDRWGSQGGRVYCTALGALCLEVYYRYSEALTSFATAPDLEDFLLD